MRQKAEVVLYTRPGCHLCDVVREQMRAANCADLYELEEIDIDSDPILVERYGSRIPIISINGEEAFEYRVTAKAFREAVLAGNADLTSR
jgi:glutaredoxin